MATFVPALERVAACPLCGSTHSQPIMPVRDRYMGVPGAFGLVRCPGCGLVMLSPRPVTADLRRYYPDDDYVAYQAPESTMPRDRPDLAGRARDAIRAIVLRDLGYATPPVSWLARAFAPVVVPTFRWWGTYGMPMRFPRFVEGGRALDIGCGNGSYLSYLKRHGWGVEGVDLSGAAARAARDAFDITVRVGGFDDVELAPAAYDWIQMHHVIEHLPNPVASLVRVFELLKPGGALYVETPNAESFSLRFCGEFWFPWDAPRHLFVFTPSTLRAALERAGFVVGAMRSRSFAGLFAWEDTLRREEAAGSRLARRPDLSPRASPRAGALGALAGLVRIVRPLSGDVLACVAQKPDTGS